MQLAEFIHCNRAIGVIVERARTAVRGCANIVIEGASGTGKTALARYLTGACGGDAELVPVYCAANEHPGKDCALAGEDNVTLLLHEVAELSAPAQAELAMALRGGHRGQIITTSSRSLREATLAGAFREDLFYHLAVVTVSLPSLTARPEDIPLLARHFAAHFAGLHGLAARPLSADAVKALQEYHWPGNVRELENVMHSAVLFAAGDEIRSEDIRMSADRPAREDSVSAALVGRTVAEVERDLILETLRHCDGNRTQAAEILGISVRTLRNKIRQYNDQGAQAAPFSHAA